jgi:hypothetical protein
MEAGAITEGHQKPETRPLDGAGAGLGDQEMEID